MTKAGDESREAIGGYFFLSVCGLAAVMELTKQGSELSIGLDAESVRPSMRDSSPRTSRAGVADYIKFCLMNVLREPYGSL